LFTLSLRRLSTYLLYVCLAFALIAIFDSLTLIALPNPLPGTFDSIPTASETVGSASKSIHAQRGRRSSRQKISLPITGNISPSFSVRLYCRPYEPSLPSFPQFNKSVTMPSTSCSSSAPTTQPDIPAQRRKHDQARISSCGASAHSEKPRTNDTIILNIINRHIPLISHPHKMTITHID
jgi:hypothetical protein